MDERDAAIQAGRSAGLTFRDLAARHGITPARVRQICLQRASRLAAERRRAGMRASWPDPATVPPEVPIRDLGFSTRAVNALENAGHMTAGAVRAASDATLLRSFNFGRKCLAEIRAVLPADEPAVPPGPPPLLPGAPPDDLPLDALELSFRVAKRMRAAGIRTAGEARAVPDAALLRIDGFGITSLRELREQLGQAERARRTPLMGRPSWVEPHPKPGPPE